MGASSRRKKYYGGIRMESETETYSNGQVFAILTGVCVFTAVIAVLIVLGAINMSAPQPDWEVTSMGPTTTVDTVLANPLVVVAVALGGVLAAVKVFIVVCETSYRFILYVARVLDSLSGRVGLAWLRAWSLTVNAFALWLRAPYRAVAPD